VRSLLALVLAVGMVVGALYVRGGVDGDRAGGPLARQEPLQLLCAVELRPACDAVAGDRVVVRTAEAGATATALTGAAGADADLWLTVAPWPQIVADSRRRQGQDPLSDAEPVRLGRSPLVLVVWQERAAVFAQQCRTDFSWRCVGRLSGGTWADAGGDATWGPVKPGHADPARSATGLLVLGQAASDFLGTSQFSTRDLDEDAFLAWFANLERAVPNFGGVGNSPLQQMLQFGPARFDVIGTTEAEAGPLLERSAARAQRLIMRPATPLVVAEVVLAPLRRDSEGRMGEVVEPLQEALAQAGWRVEGQAPAAGVGADPMPDDAGTPPAGVLDALRIRWEETRR
jgi:hypothetical protein